MRVLYLSASYTTHDYRFLSSLAQTEHEIHFAQISNPEWWRESKALPANINIVRHPVLEKQFAWSNLMPLIWGVNQIVSTVQPDVVHAGPLHKAAFFASHGIKPPLVSMSWGSDLLYDSEHNKFLRWAVKAALAQSTVLICDCEAVRRKAIEFGFHHEHIVMFPWGIDLNLFNHKVKKSTQEDGSFTLLSNRHWSGVHNVTCVVEAFILAAREIPALKLLLLSDGPQSAEITKMITDANMLDRVEMPGFLPNEQLPGYYQRADLYVAASLSDGSSVSLMEALASGLPVLVTDMLSNREWVDEGVEGWLFPENDPVAMAEKMKYAYHHRSNLQPMRFAARQKAELKANWNENFKMLLSAYDLALQLKG